VKARAFEKGGEGGREGGGGEGKLRLGSGKRTGKKLRRMREMRSRGMERPPLGCRSHRGKDDDGLEGEGEGQEEGEEEAEEGGDVAVGRGVMPATKASAPIAVCAAASAGGHLLGKLLPLLACLRVF